MELVRAVRTDDLDELWTLITQATYGLTTLQIDKEQLSERVENSVFAFGRKTEKASGEPYVFVMEDTSIGRLVGLSCIFSKTGGYQPFYSYRRVRENNYCKALDRAQEVEFLQLEKIHDGPTEIGSLFLLPSYRAQGRGRLLSLSRFAFIAAHPKRFDELIIAEMRGPMDDAGECLFWEAVGRHFFQMDFPQADSLSTINKRFIEDLMPKHPIYTCLLPEAAREALGDVHVHTRPALTMLLDEGFEKCDWIDIFDGGPVVRCEREKIDAVRRTRSLTVRAIGKSEETAVETKILISFARSFSAIIGPVSEGTDGTACISELVAATLQLRVGDKIYVLALKPEGGT
ncbi:MAG: arginine N-succinyltransferase [Planctomycetales bacterium]|nr:arginine N-succinyltransferase [Planctomycetales bacterium]